ncbi:MAG: T9SS type A sorting domain-containing protein [Bacteroidota bacterium]
MKRILTFVLTLAALQALVAQVSVTASGFVTTVDGDPVENITIDIFTDTTGTNWVYFNSVQTDVNGFYSDTFDAPVTQGIAYISMVDCDGNYQTQTSSWFPGGDPSADFIYCDGPEDCSVSIFQDSIATQQGLYLYAFPSSFGNNSYVWSTGETQPWIFAPTSGTYCVTMTNAFGCVAEACTEVDLTNTCFVSMYTTPSGSLQAYGGGSAPISYLWSTGDTTDAVLITGPGQYCVTLSDAAGCEASDCFVVETADSCSVDITVYPDSIGGNTLFASPYGVSPFSYNWSTGENSQSITVYEDSLYCVTVTDFLGCEAIACADVIAPPACQEYIFITADGDGLVASAPGGIAYSWNTGETTGTIYPDQIGTYCVTTTFADGCVATACQYWCPIWAEDCTVTIEGLTISGDTTTIAFKAVPDGIAPFTYLWSTGETSDVIFPTQQGNYCVTVTDAVGCEASTCTYYFSNECAVEIGSTITCAFGAVPLSGTAPFTYHWSTGDSIPCINPSSSGTYCVTMTDATGCIATDCDYFYHDDSTLCSVDIIVVQNGTFLFADPTGVPPFSYDWSAYGNTQSIEIPEDGGIYCLTVTDAIGCTVVECGEFPVDTTQQNSQIQGLVWPADTTTIDWYAVALVTLIQLDETGEPQIVETQEIASSNFGLYYDFGERSPGAYLVLAEFLPESQLNQEYIPTYHLSSMGWENADTIIIPNNNQSPFYDVFMIPLEGLAGDGEGEISGSVTNNSDGFTSGGIGEEKNLIPMEGVTLVLMDAFSRPLAQAKTNALGEYRFEALPWGTYQLVMEMLGHEQTIIWITIGPDNPGSVVDFSIEDGTTIVTDVEELVVANSLELWPNPTSANVELRVELLEATAVQLQVHSPAGQLLWGVQENWPSGVQNRTISLNDFPDGLYFISIQTEKETIVRKVLKQ